MGQAKLRERHAGPRPTGAGHGAPVHRTEARVTVGVFALLGLLGLVAYHNAFRSPFIWDDPYLITDNYLIKSFSHLPEIFTHHLYYSTAGLSNFYRPLQTFFLMVDYAVWTLNPFGYHLTSFLFHVLTAFFAFLVIHRLFQRPVVAVLVSALFVVHPINSTVVDYISSRADSQAALFVLISVWCFLKWRTVGGSQSARRWYIGSLGAFALALLSKELAIILPLLLVAVRWARGERGDGRTGPFWVLGGLYLVLRLTVLKFPDASSAVPPPLFIRLLTSAEAVVRLIGLMVVPHAIHIEKSLPFAAGLGEPRTFLSIAVLLAVGGFMAWVRRRSPLCFLGLVWFFVCLLPMSNIIPLNTTLADHWLYLPGIGFLLAVIGGLADAVRGVGWRRTLLAGYGLALAAFTGLTVRQNMIWRNPKEFFRLALVYSPGSFRAHNELGVLYLNEEKFQEAVGEFQSAVHLNPNFDQAYDNLGIAYDHLGELEQAVEAHQVSLQLNPHNPKVYNNLGNAYFKMGRFDKAIEAYQEALRLNPHYLSVYNNLGAAYYRQGKREDAKRVWEKALAINPGAEGIQANLELLRPAPPADQPPEGGQAP